MSDPINLPLLRERLALAHGMVSDLCKRQGEPGWRRWEMSIPANPSRDPDLVIAAGLDAGDALAAEVERLTARVADLEQARAGDVARIAWFLRLMNLTASEATGEEFVRAVWRRGVSFSPDGKERLKAEARDIAASEARLALTKAADAIDRGDWRDAPLPPDPRDARIAALEAEAAGLRAVADTVTGGGSR